MARRLGLLLAVGGATLFLAAGAFAAAPNYILVDGPGLSRPVLLADWQQNLRLLLAVADAPRVDVRVAATLASRPRFDLAEFWAWGKRPRPTSPARASQHGRFYPAHGSLAAVVVLQVQGVVVPRAAPPLLLRVLAGRGVPVRL